jgi:hypothetical protein
MENKHLARHDWISACGFHSMDEREVLNQVLASTKSNAVPIVVLDLDSTLYEVRPRTFQILKEWKEDSKVPAQFKNALDRMEISSVGYSLKDTFRSLEINWADFFASDEFHNAKSFWSSRFFSSEYLKFDHAYEGAAEFCKALRKEGAELIYLTGRDEKNMGEGTRSNLERDGFPLDDKTHMMLKKSPQDSDVEHKKMAAEWINKRGTVVASFENEPANLIALYERFPQSMHIFVDTICSDHPAQPREGLYRIRDWS